jgi:ABC-type antimicrobial peptide transport system permease subunit
LVKGFASLWIKKEEQCMTILKAVGLALLAGIVGYGVGVGLGMLLVYTFSTNQYDKDLEAAMTGFFCAGPALAILGVIVGLVFFWYLKRR